MLSHGWLDSRLSPVLLIVVFFLLLLFFLSVIVMVPLDTADLVVVPAFPLTDGMGVFRMPLSFSGIFEP